MDYKTQGYNIIRFNINKSSQNNKFKGAYAKKVGYNFSEFKAIRAKTEEEVAFLEYQFGLDPTWNRKTVQIWKQALALHTSQIYKWGYDRKRLLAKNRRRQNLLSKISDQELDKAYQKELSDYGLNELVSRLVEGLESDTKLTQDVSDNSSEIESEITEDKSLMASYNMSDDMTHIPWAQKYEEKSKEILADPKWTKESKNQDCIANLEPFPSLSWQPYEMDYTWRQSYEHEWASNKGSEELNFDKFELSLSHLLEFE